MMPARVRLLASDAPSLVALVAIPGKPERRVRWTPPHQWHCSACGAQPIARCAHARAVVNSPDYLFEFTTTGTTPTT